MALSESQKGRMAETLIAAHLVLGSDGLINVSTPLVDDEGVDLLLNLRDKSKHMLLQVKSRFGLSGKGSYIASLKRSSFKPSEELYILFAFIDLQKLELGETAWLVPSLEFKQRTSNQTEERPILRFTSRFTSKKDMWVDFKMMKKELPQRIITIMEEM